MRHLSIASTVALVCTTPAFAQDTPFMLDEIVFSAGLTALEAARTGATVEVIEGDALREAGNIQVSDYLARLPGITVLQSGPSGTTASIRVRGLDGRYVPVLLNGINITDPASIQSSLDFGTLTTGGIGRIEVLYGSQGALYGSEAIAGVVSITTVEPPQENGTETTLTLEAGSYRTLYGSIGVGTRFDRGTLTFSASRTDTEGFSAAEENDGNTEADGFTDTTLTLGGTFDLTETISVGASLFAQSSSAEYDASEGPGGDDPTRVADTERRGARVFVAYDGLTFDHDLSYSFSETIRSDPAGFTTDFDGQRQEIRAMTTADIGTYGTLTVGLESAQEEFATDGPFGGNTGSISNIAGFADYAVALGSTVDLSASLRYDDHSRFGGQTTGRVALAWRPDQATVVRASVGTGFRAPSLFELFASGFGNPALTPETSVSAELGVERSFARGAASATLFYTEITDLIGFAAGSYNQVPGTTVSQGVEVSGLYDITDALTLFGNYTYTDARNEGVRLPRVPRHAGVIGLNAEITDRIGLSIQGQGAVDTAVSSFAVYPLDDYFVVDASASYAVTDDVEAYLRIENLLDEEYQTVPGYGTSDRAFYLGLRARF